MGATTDRMIFHQFHYDKRISAGANRNILKLWLAERTDWSKEFCGAAARLATESTVGEFATGPTMFAWNRGRFALGIEQ
jgi:hypothetical protein